MDPPECEAAPVVEVLGLAVTLVAGRALVVPALPPPCAPNPPRNPPIDAPRAMAGAGGEWGAIRACGAELRCVDRRPDVVAFGPRREGGAPLPRASEGGADWTKDFGFANPIARAVAFVDCVVGALKPDGGAVAVSKLIPPRARGMRDPAPIAPFAPCPARITVDGTAAS